MVISYSKSAQPQDTNGARSRVPCDVVRNQKDGRYDPLAVNKPERPPFIAAAKSFLLIAWWRGCAVIPVVMACRITPPTHCRRVYRAD